MNFFLIYACLLQMASLTVGELLSIHPAPNGGKQIKFVGDDYYVPCESSGKNVQRVMWTGPDGHQITNYKARIQVEDGSSGHKSVDLIFKDINMKDKGNYTCSANVDGNEVQVYFELVIYKNIDFTDTPKEQFLEEGSDSTVICNVKGEPKPQVSWKVHDKRIKSKMGQKFLKSPENPSWIVVTNVTLDDKGKYECNAGQITQKTSKYKSFEIDVTVHHKPLPSKEKMEQPYSYVTGVVNLTCEAEAEPHANFTWLKDNVIITPSENVKIFDTDHRSILQLTVEDDEMFGDYYCIAENRLGNLERVVTLGKGEKPTVPKTEVKETKRNAFRLSMVSENNPDMPVIGYKVEYKKAGEEWSKAGIREFEAGKPYILDGLQSDTLYALRTSAKNVAGYSDYSKDLMQKTEKPRPVKEGLSGGMSYASSAPFLMINLSALLCAAVFAKGLTS